MNILAKLNEELDQVRQQREALRARHPGDTMPEEARSEDEQLTTRALKITKGIEIEKQRERDAAFEKSAAYMSEPKYQIQRAVNSDDDGRLTLQRAGWNFKNGMLVRQTSVGEYALCAEEVMFGPVPTNDASTAQYFNQTRALFQPEYRAAFANYIKQAAMSRSEAMGLSRLSPAEQNALSEGTAADGGFLVPADLQSEILARTAQRSVMRQICRIVNTSRDRVIFPAVAPHATSGSLYSSGFVGSWSTETPAFSDTDPGFQQFEIAVKKLRVATKMSTDWLADAGSNMLAFLSANGAENMALVEDNGLIAGTGANNTPVGILNSGITTADVEGSTSDTISNTTSAAGSAPKITALEYLVPAQYVSGSSWLMRRAIEGDVRALVDANGRPYWLSATESGFGGTPRTIDGYPVYNSDSVPNDGTNANKVMVFGNFGYYIIVQRAQISTTVLRERFADTDQTGIILSERIGGGCWNTDAFRIGIV